MKRYHKFLILFVLPIIFTSILFAGTKLRIITKVDGIDREYLIHIPMNYDSSKTVPLVFMLHGTGGDGDEFYNLYGWKELADKEGFLAVFPSSGRYKVNEDGDLKTTTKWNTLPDANWTLQAGEKGLNDIKFLRKVIDEMNSRFKIDHKRIYLNGFSNGGQMAAKCAIEMSDVLAAACSNAGSFYIDTVYTPKRKIPYLYEVGNKDYGSGNEGPEAPLSYFDELISTPGLPYKNGHHYLVDNRCIQNFNLKREFTLAGDTNFVMVATHQPNKPGPGTGYEFKFVFVKGLAHIYPNGKQHPYDGVTAHWNWMKQYVLEDSTTKNTGTKIRVVTKVEEVDREYYIHLPANYDSSKPVPMVMFFHGGGHDGELMYNISGWNEVADTAGIIMVYPSSLKYCVIEDEVQKQLSQWNNGHSSNTFCPNQKMKDDVLFINTILQHMSSRYKIDAKRIYTVGFSNGGEFAASRTAIELSDKIAASISCGGGGSLPRDTVLIPKRKLPVMLMFGNKDDRLLKAVNAPVSVPMGFDVLYTAYPVLYFAQVSPYINSFGLDDKNYTTVGDTNTVQAAIFKGKSGDPQNIFYLVEVKNLEHEYPNGINHAIHGANYHWRWMRQYSLNSTIISGFTLTTNEGYGSGQYEKGDTIHIWSKQIDGKVFTNWSGDIQYLESPNEYHSRVFMPAKNMTVTANYASLTATMDFSIMNIKGAERNKKTYVYIPTDKNKINGVVWFFHGTNGNPASMIADPDARQMMNLLMVRDYAVVAYYSEESEYNLDFNNDGEYRYTYGIDSNLLDIANVRAIQDTFIKRNLINRNTSHAAIGWSAGGAFTEFIANSLGWKAAINHTSSGNATLSLSSKAIVPYIAAINENDNNQGVGPLGNQEARTNVQNYKNRGACAILHEQKQAPLFPERFDRSPLISEQLSRSIFAEIKNNGGLDAKNYLKGLANELKAAVLTNPGKFPVIIGLSLAQREEVQKQVEVTNAEHSLKADINGLSLKFIEQACGMSTPAKEDIKKSNNLILFPNPTSYTLNMPHVKEWKIYNVSGQLILIGKNDQADVSSLQGGIYFLMSDQGIGKFVIN